MAALAKIACRTVVGKEVMARGSKGVMAGPVMRELAPYLADEVRQFRLQVMEEAHSTKGYKQEHWRAT